MDASTPEVDAAPEPEPDPVQVELLARLEAELGDALLEHADAHGTLVARVSNDAWALTAQTALTALTAREEEVLRLVAWGFSNKEIAAQLGLSVKTIETHKTNASNKLGLHNRSEIVRWALLQGWLKDP